MQLAGNLGLDVGEHLHHNGPTQGGEWKPWRELSMAIAGDLVPSLEPDRPAWNRVAWSRRGDVLEKHRAAVEALRWPRIVKMPNLGWSPALKLIDPELVVLSLRDGESWVASMQQRNRLAASLSVTELMDGAARNVGHLLIELETHGIPYRTCLYPKVARDVAYAWEVFGTAVDRPYDEFENAWRETVNEDWMR